MPNPFFKQRLLPFPTVLGWIVLLVAIGSPMGWLLFRGEPFFRLTERQPAECLVVEGWIGIDGVTAAKAEFERGGYHYIATSGGLTNNRWGRQQWNYAVEAGELLVHLGVPADRVVIAPAADAENHRTFEAAVEVRQMLTRLGLHPQYATIFTFGVHARRSRLVFAKAMGASTNVGVISWAPEHFFDGPWWHSSERSLDLLKESVGYFFELLLNSGRFTNQPPPDNVSAKTQRFSPNNRRFISAILKKPIAARVTILHGAATNPLPHVLADEVASAPACGRLRASNSAMLRL
jgi:hypothetical protein